MKSSSTHIHHSTVTEQSNERKEDGTKGKKNRRGIASRGNDITNVCANTAVNTAPESPMIET